MKALIGLVFLMVLFIAGIVMVPAIFGSAEQDMNMTENSTYYNETQGISRIVLMGVELSPLVFAGIGIAIVIIIALIGLSLARII